MKIRDYFTKHDKDTTRIVLSYMLDKSFSEVVYNQDYEIDSDMVEKIDEVFDKINTGYPIQYALKKWNFYGRDFDIDEDVLIPRRETELLVELVLKEKIDGKKILDIGTGSGAIAISIKLENPKAEVYASDISPKAIVKARGNAEKLGANVTFIESDLFENIGQKFDFIVSNPPYISQKDYDNLEKLLYFEPKNALLGGELGHEIYARIISEAKQYLNPHGKILFEIGFDQAQIVSELLEKSGFTNIKVHKDYGGYDRIVEGTN